MDKRTGKVLKVGLRMLPSIGATLDLKASMFNRVTAAASDVGADVRCNRDREATIILMGQIRRMKWRLVVDRPVVVVVVVVFQRRRKEAVWPHHTHCRYFAANLPPDRLRVIFASDNPQICRYLPHHNSSLNSIV